jgi:hypothetical protein
MQGFDVQVATARREVEELKADLPADGAGYTQQVEELYRKKLGSYITSVSDPDVRDELTALAEIQTQNAITSGIQFERETAKGYAYNSIRSLVAESRGVVYDDPSRLSEIEEAVGQKIAASPLSALEKAELSEEALQDIEGAAFSGRSTQLLRSRVAFPGSPEAQTAFDTLLVIESGADPNVADSKPHPVYGGSGGALGIAQVTHGTGQMIAGQMQDPNFPWEGTEKEQKAYIRKHSERYGKFHFNDLLRKHGGDIRLALIEYNGGPGGVRKFRSAGNNPAGLTGPHRQTREYVEKFFNEAGFGNPWLAPLENVNREGLSVEQRQQVDEINAQFEQSRLEAAQAARDISIEDFEREFDQRADRLLSAVFANPEMADVYRGRIEEFLDENGVTGREKEQLLHQVEQRVQLIEAEHEPGGLFTDPKYEDIPYKQKRQLLEQVTRQAEQDRLAAEAATEEERRRRFNRAMVAAEDGRLTRRDLPTLLEADVVSIDEPEYRRLRDAIDKAQIDNTHVREVNTAMARDQPLEASAENRDKLALYLEKTGIMAGLTNPEGQAQRGPDQEAFDPQQELVRVWESSGGVMPTNAKAWLEARTDGFDTNAAMDAYALLSQMRLSRPNRFAEEMGTRMDQRVAAYDALNALNVPESTIAARLNARRLMDPNELKELQTQAGTWFTGDDAFTPENLQREFGSRIPFVSDPTFGEGLAQTANATEMWSDYRALFNELYIMHGDQDAAHDAAMEGVEKLWGSFNGTLVKYPPSSFYQAVDQSHDWVLDQFRREYNVQENDRIVIASDTKEATTRINNGLKPSYNMLIVRENGDSEYIETWVADFEAESEYRMRQREVLGVDPATPQPSVESDLENRSAREAMRRLRERDLELRR